MPKPVEVQLAIQGGGARLTAILGVLQAVAELQEEGELRVTRIAATSAGAIAGALFAAPVDMDVVHTHLRGRAAELAQRYRMPGGMQIAKQLLTGAPFWDVTALKASLAELFGSRTTLGELEKEIIIIATDLKNLRKVVRKNKTDPLLDSILDSCAIPLFFRTFAREKNGAALIVDGGICANLPSEELVDGQDGEIIGISFATKMNPVNPTGVIDFATALLNTAMDHSVLRARQQLGKRLLSIETEIDPFDFARAMTEGLGPEWDNCYHQAKEFFEEYVQSTLAKERRQQEEATEASRRTAEVASEEAKRNAEQAESTQRQALRIQELTSTLNEVRSKVMRAYERQEAPKPFLHERVSMLVIGYSLEGSSQNDLMIRKMRFSPAKEPVYAYRWTTLTSATEQPVSDDFRIYDRDGNELGFQKIELTPVQKMVNGTQTIHYPRIMYFDAPLLPADPRGPFDLVTYERYTGIVTRLRTDDDWLSIKVSRTATPVAVIDIVVHLPKSYASTILSGGGIRDESGTWVDFHPGMAIAPPILNKEYAPPDGFFALGWRGENVPIGKRFGCIINRYKGANQ